MRAHDQCFDACCPETSSCASNPLLLLCKLVLPQCLCQFSLGLKMGPMTLYITRCLFAQKSVNINFSMSACPKLALVPVSRYYCKQVIPQCLCQVSLGLKRFRWGPMTSNLTRCFFFALKSVNIYVSMSAAPKLALVPASRYACYVK